MPPFLSSAHNMFLPAPFLWLRDSHEEQSSNSSLSVTLALSLDSVHIIWTCHCETHHDTMSFWGFFQLFSAHGLSVFLTWVKKNILSVRVYGIWYVPCVMAYGGLCTLFLCFGLILSFEFPSAMFELWTVWKKKSLPCAFCWAIIVFHTWVNLQITTHLSCFCLLLLSISYKVSFVQYQNFVKLCVILNTKVRSLYALSFLDLI